MMNNINYHRYCDSISIQGHDKKTFLNKWYRSNVEKFNEHFKDEWNNYHNLADIYFSNKKAADRYGVDLLIKDISILEKHFSPIRTHKFLWYLVKIPFLIECWLCCGWKLHYNKELRLWEYGEYHMMSKLCHRNAHVTWWDKLRFKWITGYNWED